MVTPRKLRMCVECNLRPAEGGHGAKYCLVCRQQSESLRNARRPERALSRELGVCVDSESGKFDGENRMVTLSYGAEDGTSHSLKAAPGGWIEPEDAAMWLFEHLSGPFAGADGAAYKAVLLAFHFDHDIGLLVRHLWDDLQIIHKSTAKDRTNLCIRRAGHDPACTKRFHQRGDDDEARRIVRDGGGGDYIAYDWHTNIGYATSKGRTFYMEHRPHGASFRENRRIDIHDVGSAFPGNLQSNLDRWQPEQRPGDRAIIDWGKQARTDNFANEERDKIAAYSEAECVQTARMARQLLNAVHGATGVRMHLSKLYGSGSIAAAVLKFYKICTSGGYDDSVGDISKKYAGPFGLSTMEDLAFLTYFGGKIAAPSVGLVGQANTRDINSAYPSKMVQLPCMRRGHGHWVKSRTAPPEGIVVGHVNLSFQYLDSPSMVMPFLVRHRNGRVNDTRTQQNVWTTLAEYRAAEVWREEHHGHIHPHEFHYWVADCDCGEPLDFVSHLYDKRLSEKKRSKDESLSQEERDQATAYEQAVKLVINSLYGKFAETRHGKGRYTNLHYASTITGMTRAQLNVEAWENERLGGVVAYMHTDSVTAVGVERPDEGKALGKWGSDPSKQDYVVVQAGIAVDLASKKGATRGVAARTFIPYLEQWISERRSMFLNHPTTWEDMRPQETRMYTIRQAHAMGKPNLAGTFATAERVVRFNSPKRPFQHAVAVPDKPGMWLLPPAVTVPQDEVATLQDLKAYKAEQKRLSEEGVYDNSITGVFYSD